jgi:hypothetical protein
MGLGFHSDTLQDGDQFFYLLTRPLDTFILDHGGHIAPRDPNSAWTPYSVEWSINHGYLWLIRFSRSNIESHFDFGIPDQLTPLLEGLEDGIKADWFTGFIPVYTKSVFLGTPSYPIDQLPLTEFEYLLVFKHGKHINTIKNCHFVDVEYKLFYKKGVDEHDKTQIPITRKTEERLKKFRELFLD